MYFSSSTKRIGIIKDYKALCEPASTGNYEGNDQKYQVSRGNGFISIKNTESHEQPNNRYDLGWKLHISINTQDSANFEKAWEIFAALALEHSLASFKVIDNMSHGMPGKEITIYCAREGEPEKIRHFLSALDKAYNNSGVKANPHPLDCQKFSEFISFRNDRCLDSQWPQNVQGERRRPSPQDASGYISENHACLAARALLLDPELKDCKNSIKKAIADMQQEPNVPKQMKDNLEHAEFNPLLMAQVTYIMEKSPKPFDITNPFNLEDGLKLKESYKPNRNSSSLE